MGGVWYLIQLPFVGKIETSQCIEEKYEIYSLDTIYQKEDQFILGTKSDSEGTYYYYIRKDKDNNYKLEHEKEFEGHDVEIVYTNEETPKLVYVYERKALPENYQIWLGHVEYKKQTGIKIIIPENSNLLQYDG